MKRISKTQKRRITEATENYEEIKKKLAPFYKPRKILNPSTYGQWQRASSEDIIFSFDRGESTSIHSTSPTQGPKSE